MKKSEYEMIVRKAAEKGAEQAVKSLYESGKLKRIRPTSAKKTEEVLKLYKHLPEDHPERIRVDKAFERLGDDEHKDILASRYFDGLTIDEIAEIYNCSSQAIIKQKDKLVRQLAKALFPEDVLREILD